MNPSESLASVAVYGIKLMTLGLNGMLGVLRKGNPKSRL